MFHLHNRILRNLHISNFTIHTVTEGKDTQKCMKDQKYLHNNLNKIDTEIMAMKCIVPLMAPNY